MQATLACGIIAAVIAPGFLWPWWFRFLMTALLVLLGILVARAYLVAFASFKRPADPPEKPDDAPWPKVSVLVPAYNEASVLPRTMESMLRIDYPADRIEFVYAVEKRSSDGSIEVARSFAARDPRFVVLERDERTGGKAAATNYGLARCTGEIIVLLDADHSLAPDAVKRAARWFLADERTVCIKGRCQSVNPRESLIALLAKLERDVIEKGDLYVRHLWGSFSFFGGGQVIFRRSLFDAIGVFDEDILVEDIDFSVRIHRAGLRLVIDPLINSFEEHPAHFSAWFAQRKRWARGWMQVAVRYLRALRTMPNLTWRQRADLYMTLSYVIVPVIFVVGLPILALGQLTSWFAAEPINTKDYLWPWSRVAWIVFFVSPPVAWLTMYIQDRRAGILHARREWLALPLLWPYLVFQSIVFWAAFLEEFVLRRPSVYVKTAKTGQAPTAGGRRRGRARPTPVLQED
jgi:cellulose synthase/poly-beta-1,6-N-acetylglucosamine synthase-like glycosyltransferase